MSRLLQAGQLVLGRFVAERVLSRNARATTWLAAIRDRPEQAVIKIFHPTGPSVGRMERQQVLELRQASRVRHQHLVDVLALGSVRKRWVAVATRYLPGPTLSYALERKGVLSPVATLKVALQCADGLMALHRAGMVHHGVHPEHIVLFKGKDGRATSSLLAPSCSLGWRFLSPEDWCRYRAPEVRLGRADAASDVYSLGAVMWRMLTGVELPQANADGQPWSGFVQLAPQAPAVPADLEVLVRAMLWRDPTRRPQLALVRAQLAQLRVSLSQPEPGLHKSEVGDSDDMRAAVMTPDPCFEDSIPGFVPTGQARQHARAWARSVRVFLGCMPIWLESLERALKGRRDAQALSVAQDVFRGAAVVGCRPVVERAQEIIGILEGHEPTQWGQSLEALKRAHKTVAAGWPIARG